MSIFPFPSLSFFGGTELPPSSFVRKEPLLPFSPLAVAERKLPPSSLPYGCLELELSPFFFPFPQNGALFRLPPERNSSPLPLALSFLFPVHSWRRTIWTPFSFFFPVVEDSSPLPNGFGRPFLSHTAIFLLIKKRGGFNILPPPTPFSSLGMGEIIESPYLPDPFLGSKLFSLATEKTCFSFGKEFSLFFAESR